MTSFADFALATATLPAERLERQNVAQPCVYTPFSFGSSRCKNVFPGVSGQFQIGPTKCQFQFPNESKARQRKLLIEQNFYGELQINSFFLPLFPFLHLLGLLFLSHTMQCCTKQVSFHSLPLLEQSFLLNP